MNSAPIEFHKIWIDQCAATEGIRETFGLDDALNYLIGEKLFSFLHAAERDPLFAPRCLTLSGRSGGFLQPKRSATILIAWKDKISRSSGP